jgi:membrane-bound lytic murein transglycosylase F
MMLTQRTAEELGVDRLDANEAIKGGVRYLAQLRDRLPNRLIEEERLSMALAAYNIGLRNLESARVLTQKAGKNPDHWEDVQTFLPQLTVNRNEGSPKRKLANGRQAVQFVSNIKMYYDILCRLEPELPKNYVSERKIATREDQLISPIF